VLLCRVIEWLVVCITVQGNWGVGGLCYRAGYLRRRWSVLLCRVIEW